MAAKPPTVVAELGRPETPEETAQRKAAASQRRRANQTALNLVLATLASLGVVLFLVFVVVRPTPEPPAPVDYVAIAAESGRDVLAPDLPDGWTANAARLETVGGVTTWTIGFVTPAGQYIALDQGLQANETWLADAVLDAEVTGAARIGGLDWALYDRRDSADPGNHAFILSTQIGEDLVVLHGTADDTEFETLAEAIGKAVQ